MSEVLVGWVSRSCSFVCASCARSETPTDGPLLTIGLPVVGVPTVALRCDDCTQYVTVPRTDFHRTIRLLQPQRKVTPPSP